MRLPGPLARWAADALVRPSTRAGLPSSRASLAPGFPRAGVSPLPGAGRSERDWRRSALFEDLAGSFISATAFAWRAIAWSRSTPGRIAILSRSMTTFEWSFGSSVTVTDRPSSGLCQLRMSFEDLLDRGLERRLTITSKGENSIGPCGKGAPKVGAGTRRRFKNNNDQIRSSNWGHGVATSAPFQTVATDLVELLLVCGRLFDSTDRRAIGSASSTQRRGPRAARVSPAALGMRRLHPPFPEIFEPD